MQDQTDKKPSHWGQITPKLTLFQLFADKGFEAIEMKLRREAQDYWHFTLLRSENRIAELEKGIVDLEARLKESESSKELGWACATEISVIADHRLEDIRELRSQLAESEECRSRQSATITKYQRHFIDLKKTVDALN